MQLVLLRRCMYRTARVVLCQPAGVTTAPCRIDPTGLPEQALNLLLLAVSPSGTRKTMTKSHALRSQAVAPTTWNPAARTIPRCPFIIRRQSSTANRQPSNPPQRSRLPNDNRPATAHLLPPAAAMSPPAGTPFVTGTSSRIKARRQMHFCVAPAAQHNRPPFRRQPASGHPARLLCKRLAVKRWRLFPIPPPARMACDFHDAPWPPPSG